MKTMKKVLAMLVSMVMVLAFCVTGVAADVELTQHTFAAYQIFKGDLTEGNKLSNVTWGDGVQGEELLAELNTQAAFATLESSTSFGPSTTKPYSTPRAVSTITWSPTQMSSSLGEK